MTIGGNWSASDIAAGASAGPDQMFGTGDDAPISADNPIIATIASTIIKGTASGTTEETDHFGFVAEQVAGFKVGGAKLALMAGARNDLGGLAVGSADDLRVREVA